MSKKMQFNNNPEFIDTLEENAKYYINQLNAGKNAHEIAVQMYMNALGKNEKVAETAVAEIENLIQQYHNDLGMLGLSSLEAIKNIDKEELSKAQNKLIDDQLNDRVSGVESAQERCRIYYQILLALEAYRISTDGQENALERAKDHVDRYAEFNLSEEKCIECEEAMRQDVINAFSKTTFLSNEMSDILTEIEFVETNEELATIVVGYGEASKDYKLVLCTRAYIDSVNDVYKDLNSTTSMKQIVYATCLGSDTGALAQEVKKGKVEFPLFKFILSVLGAILGAFIGILFAVSFAGTIAGLFALSGIAYLVVFGLLFFLSVGGTMEIVGGAIANVGKTIGNAIDSIAEDILTFVRNCYDSLTKENVEYVKSDLEKYCIQRSRVSTNSTASKIDRNSAIAVNKYYDDNRNSEENEDHAIEAQPAKI